MSTLLDTEILPIIETILYTSPLLPTPPLLSKTILKQSLQSQTKIKIEDENVINIDDESNGYIEKLNYDIGYFWWKQYVYCAFWNNISTPINLLITILTALTTGQSATNSLILFPFSILNGLPQPYIFSFAT